jgi:FKBP-type peptidyl-prolyl cis-trans isomerase 2
VFDSSAERGPIELTIGEKQVIAGFENALAGMEEGETKTVTLEPQEAYGAHDPNLVHVVERTRLPEDIELSIGAELQATAPDGNQMRLAVTEFDNDNVKLDANHPLAGRTLIFEMTLVRFVA